MGRGTIGGHVTDSISGPSKRPVCLQVTSNTACPCLSALTKRKECFPPQHGCVGIKTHSEWPRVVQQMLARIALVAVPTVSRRDRPALTKLSLCTCMEEREGVLSQWRACHTLKRMVVGNLSQWSHTNSSALSLIVITHIQSYVANWRASRYCSHAECAFGSFHTLGTYVQVESACWVDIITKIGLLITEKPCFILWKLGLISFIEVCKVWVLQVFKQTVAHHVSKSLPLCEQWLLPPLMMF